MYKLGIKRRFWFGYQWYFIVDHRTEVLGDGARMVMTLPDGVKIAVPSIQKRGLCVYPEPRIQNQIEE